jgi:hypothetical protein
VESQKDGRGREKRKRPRKKQIDWERLEKDREGGRWNIRMGKEDGGISRISEEYEGGWKMRMRMGEGRGGRRLMEDAGG